MRKVTYLLCVLDENGYVVMNQELYREDWNGLMGHLNKEVKKWKSLKITKYKKGESV